MKVFFQVLLIASTLASVPGCSFFKKDRTPQSGGLFNNGPILNRGTTDPPKFPSGADPLLQQNPNLPPPLPPQQVSQGIPEAGLLAGRVLDGSSRPASYTHIQWAPVDDNKSGAAPVDVAVNQDGFFTIQGLKPGTTYKLIARGKQGDKTLAGVTYTQAPNIRVVIQVKEEFVTPNTPALPGQPGATTPEQKSATTGAIFPWQKAPSGSPVQNALAQTPITSPPVNVPEVPQLASANTAVPAGSWQPIAGGTASPRGGPNDMPLMSIPPVSAIPSRVPNSADVPAEAPKAPPIPTSESRLQTGPARVPSCVLVGDRLVNLALTETTGQTWEWKKHRRGKLVLVDFWATYCRPCIAGMPHLSRLQSSYGSKGLEVIGIACENDGTTVEQANRVFQMCQRLNVNYRQLLGEPSRGDLIQQFHIEGYPTMILFDESGKILWRHTGGMDRGQFDTLERFIASRLNGRLF